MDIQTILYVISAGIIALLLALFQYLYKSKKRSGISFLLTVLRFLTLFSVFLLLINPKFESHTYYDEKPNLIVAVDNSESVAYLERASETKALVDRLKSDKDLNNHFDIQFYSFGKELHPLNSLTFSEKQTNPSAAFDRFNQVYQNSTAPIILLTDGNQTFGNDYEYEAQKLKQVIFPIILGDTTRYVDLKLEQLNVNRYAFLNNKFPVEVIATYNGNNTVATQLIISSRDKTVYSKNLTFDAANTSQIINLTLPASSQGIHSYKASLQPIVNERNTINNIKNFGVEVIDRKTSVAIVSDILHPDLGALKKAIESTEQSEAKIISPSEFINTQTDFEQVVLYQPTEKFRAVYKMVQESGLNTFTVLGTTTDFEFYNTSQNEVRQSITNQTEEFEAAINPNFNLFIINDLDFANYPPLQAEFGATDFTIKPEVILFKSINGIQLKEPLLFSYESNQSKHVVLNGEGLWRWRAQNFLNEKSFQTFDDFIGKMIQYLVSHKSRSRLNVDYKSFYDGNDNVVIGAQLFNQTYEFDANATLEIVVVNQDNQESKTYPFVLKNKNYQVDLSGISAGDYSFTVSVKNQNLEQKGQFTILDYSVEQQFLNADVTKLKRIAENSKGTVFFIDNTSELKDQLINDPRFVTVQKSVKNNVPLIDLKFLLAFIALCLAAEWFLRKYHGLI